MSRRKTKIALLGVAFVLVAGVESLSMGGRSGPVLNTTTGQRIADAQITIDCSFPGLIHGDHKLRTIHVVSNSDGFFTVSTVQLFGCYWGGIQITKPGFVDAQFTETGYDPISFSRIPESLYMIPASDLAMARIKYLANDIKRGPWKSLDGRSVKPDQYCALYATFYESTLLATTEDEHAFVRKTWCDYLGAFHSSLSDAELLEVERLNLRIARRGTLTCAQQSAFQTYCKRSASE